MPKKPPSNNRPLTRSQTEYCRLRAGGEMTKTDCYLQAFPRCKSKKTAAGRYQQLELDPRIQAEIQRLQDATETSLVLSRQEKREFLARVVRANLGELDESSDLVDSVTRRYDKDGNEISTTFKLPSKAQCIEIDNKMAGHNEPEEMNIHHDGGVMLVPTGGGTLDEWEKEAVAQQKKLTAGDKKAPGKK